MMVILLFLLLSVYSAPNDKSTEVNSTSQSKWELTVPRNIKRCYKVLVTSENQIHLTLHGDKVRVEKLSSESKISSPKEGTEKKE